MKKRYIKIFSDKYKIFIKFYNPNRLKSLYYEDIEIDEFCRVIANFEWVVTNPRVLKYYGKNIELYFPNIKQFISLKNGFLYEL